MLDVLNLHAVEHINHYGHMPIDCEILLTNFAITLPYQVVMPVKSLWLGHVL